MESTMKNGYFLWKVTPKLNASNGLCLASVYPLYSSYLDIFSVIFVSEASKANWG